MFGPEHYVPVLKGKKGELDALRQLEPTIAAGMTPLIEVPPVPWDYANDAPSKTYSAHMASVTAALVASWPHEGRVFVDALSSEEANSDPRQHSAREMLDGLRSAGIDAVLGVGPHHDAGYHGAARAVAEDYGDGLCVRVAADDLDGLLTVPSGLDDYLADLGVGPNEVDLVLDLAGLNGTAPAQVALVANAQLGALPHLDDWRSLTVALSSFPQPLSDTVSPRTTARVQRDDASAYGRVAGKPDRRTPTYGDYAAEGPEYPDVDPRFMKMVGNIRYTTDDAWVIIRGERLTGPDSPGFAQYHDLAAQIAARPEYRGLTFSAGDATIHDCANRNCGPGNATTWRTVATSHHLTHVVDSIATSGAP